MKYMDKPKPIKELLGIETEAEDLLDEYGNLDENLGQVGSE